MDRPSWQIWLPQRVIAVVRGRVGICTFDKGYVCGGLRSADCGRGYFGPGEMQKEFEEAAFALKKGEMSQVVETASGVHLIERYAARARVLMLCLAND